MRKLNQSGSSIAYVVAICFLALGMFAAIGFGIWAFAERTDFKNNVDRKSAAAVAVAVAAEDKKKDAEFAEAAKKPLKTYKGPEAFGSLQVQYPKTWSAYIVENSSGVALDGYLNPDYVPVANQQGTYALRFQVTGSKYETELQQMDGQVKAGKVKVTPYRLPQLPSVLGVRVEGELANLKVNMVMLPLRDRTVKIWTIGSAYVNDFNNNILPNFTFSP